jgi:Ras-related protein Rab-18
MSTAHPASSSNTATATTSHCKSDSPPAQPPLPGLSILLKGVLLGDFAVGKSSLFQRYLFNNSEYTPTIGVDFYSCRHVTKQGHRVRLQLWDTAGQERFRSIITAYVRSVYLVYLVFDITRRATFTHLNNWIQFVHTNNGQACQFVLVANKVDRPREEWCVSEADIRTFAADHNICLVYYVSALNKLNNYELSCSSGALKESLRVAPEDTTYDSLSLSSNTSAGYYSSTSIRDMFEQSICALLEHVGDGGESDPLVHIDSLAPPDRRFLVACSDMCLARGGRLLAVAASTVAAITRECHTPSSQQQAPANAPGASADAGVGTVDGDTYLNEDGLQTPPGSPSDMSRTSGAPYLPHSTSCIPEQSPARGPAQRWVCSCTLDKSTHPGNGSETTATATTPPSIHCGSMFSISGRHFYSSRGTGRARRPVQLSGRGGDGEAGEGRWWGDRCGFC